MIQRTFKYIIYSTTAILSGIAFLHVHHNTQPTVSHQYELDVFSPEIAYADVPSDSGGGGDGDSSGVGGGESEGNSEGCGEPSDGEGSAL
jgi:hypothetical protein